MFSTALVVILFFLLPFLGETRISCTLFPPPNLLFGYDNVMVMLENACSRLGVASILHGCSATGAATMISTSSIFSQTR